LPKILSGVSVFTIFE